MTDFPASLEVIQAAQKAEKFWLAKTGADVYASVTLAQWAIESDFGKKLSGKNNPFGIKATQAQIDAGDATRCPTKEFVNGAYVAEDLWFADYASLDDAFMEHGRLLATSGYYVRARHATSAEQFAMDLEGIYATAPGYGRALVHMMRTYGLQQWDAHGASQPAAHPPISVQRADNRSFGAALVAILAGGAASLAHAAGTASETLLPLIAGAAVAAVVVAAFLVHVAKKKG